MYENILKYLYGGTFEKCKLYLIRTVYTTTVRIKKSLHFFKSLLS